MRFSAKLTAGCTALLAGALCAASLMLIGQSFSAGLEAARTALQTHQSGQAYAVLQNIFAAEEAQNGTPPLSVLAGAARQYAEQTEGSSLALWLNGSQPLYSDLPAELPTSIKQQAVQTGPESWQLQKAGGRWYLLTARPLEVPGVQISLLSAADVSGVFAARDAQLRAWLAAFALVMAAGGAAAWQFSRSVTRPLTVLQAASQSIAEGNYAQRTALPGRDELAGLSRSFDAMAEAVQAQKRQLAETICRQNDFIAAFTHEVKTPMTAMLGYADLVRAQPDDPALNREAANYIFHETRRLEALSRSLTALLKLGENAELNKQPVSDSALFAEALRSLPQAAEPEPRIEAAGRTVQADKALMADLLRNLILNAQAACKGVPGAEILVKSESENGRVVLSVQDNGCGIPAKDLPRVTEAFYMVDKSRSHANGGSGIGLALCAKIAAAHGTELKIQSREKQGTCVSLALPRAESADREEAADE